MTVAPQRPPAAFDNLDGALTVLRGAGHRVTTSRRVVLQALFESDGPVSAERIADGLGGRLTPSDPASVYRNLETLESLGIVRHVHLGHGPGLYALATAADREYLVCERCGNLRTLPSSELDPVRAQIRRRFGFEARFSHFPIAGLCERCAGGAKR